MLLQSSSSPAAFGRPPRSYRQSPGLHRPFQWVAVGYREQPAFECSTVRVNLQVERNVLERETNVGSVVGRDAPANLGAPSRA